jgi:hypothetical protein
MSGLEPGAMSDAQENPTTESNVRRLADAVREVKNAMADRDDVVVDLREAERGRLELLAAELESVAADAPAEHPAFDFAISAGAQPRYWVDSVAHVSMGRDKRTYRFVRDTRLGRVVLAESVELKPVADAVTRYVAERIVERQRELEYPGAAAAIESRPATLAEAVARTGTATQRRTNEFLTGLALLVLGMLAGAVVTLAVLRDRVPELGNLFGG